MPRPRKNRKRSTRQYVPPTDNRTWWDRFSSTAWRVLPRAIGAAAISYGVHSGIDYLRSANGEWWDPLHHDGTYQAKYDYPENISRDWSGSLEAGYQPIELEEDHYGNLWYSEPEGRWPDIWQPFPNGDFYRDD